MIVLGKRTKVNKLLGKRIKVSHRLIQNLFQCFIGGRNPKRPNIRTVKEVETVKSVRTVRRKQDKQTLSRVVEVARILVEFDREIPCVKGKENPPLLNVVCNSLISIQITLSLCSNISISLLLAQSFQLSSIQLKGFLTD